MTTDIENGETSQKCTRKWIYCGCLRRRLLNAAQ